MVSRTPLPTLASHNPCFVRKEKGGKEITNIYDGLEMVGVQGGHPHTTECKWETQVRGREKTRARDKLMNVARKERETSCDLT